MKYYAIKADGISEIVESWESAKALMVGAKNIKHKSFTNIEDAKAFLSDEKNIEVYDFPYAYIDGSYDSKTERYSFGGVLIIDNNEYHFKKSYEADEYSSYRNVAGEIKGAGYIINYCINNNIKKLHLFYDYQGIEAWYTGLWKASSAIAIEYVKFKDYAKDKIEVIFHKVKSHTNNHYNDIADKLAKEALGI